MLGLDTWGLEVVLWFQGWRTPFVESLALGFHELGQFIPYLLLLPVFFWCGDRRFGARLASWFVVGIWLNFSIKSALGLPRPYFDPSNGVQPLAEEPSLGLPSGHAQNAILFWGMVGTRVRRRWVWVAVAIYSLLMGVSRVVGGMHYPQDVIAGWLLGGLLVVLYVQLDNALLDTIDRWPLWAHLASAAGVGLAMVVVLPGEEGASFGGAMTGLIAGLAIGGRWLRFDAGGAWWRRAVRYAIGAATLVAVNLGFRAATESLEPVLAWRFVRFALTGLWMAAGAPWLFLALRLAKKDEVVS